MTTRSETEILRELRTMLAEVLGLDAESITPEARIIDELGAESIDLLDLRFRLERAFDVRVTNEDFAVAVGNPTTAMEFRQRFTVEAVGAYVRARLDSRE